MTITAGVLTLALALVTAQGGHKGGAKRKKSAPTGGAAEKRVVVPPHAEAKRAAEPAAGGAAPGTANPGAAGEHRASDGEDSPAPASGTGTKTAKTKVYTFGAMDVEGKLKTPQLLYFLNRVKLELEMSAPDHRSFMKELEKTAEDSNL